MLENLLFLIFAVVLFCLLALFLVLTLVVLPIVNNNQYTPIRRVRFFSAFGIWPKKRRFSETWGKIVQKIIEVELTSLANEYSYQDKNERHYSQVLQDLEFEKDEQKVIKEYPKWEKLLVRQKIKLNKAKKEFWGAWKLARWYGYRVKEKYTDYLPSAENQKS